MLNVHPQRFRRQIEGLLRLGYKPYRLHELIRMHRRQEPLPRRAFAVVFDDGFEDVFTEVRPILESLEAPATIFLATAYLDSPAPFPFAQWPGADASRPLTTAQCEELVGGGFFDLGSHTHTHQDFRDRPRAFRADLEESIGLLRDRFQVDSPAFSFPYGATNPDLIEAARESGVACALTTECQLVQSASDPFCWGRFGATNFDNARTLAAKLDGWYSGCRATWRRLRYGDVAKSQQAVALGPPIANEHP
jgi:peptidoglycan/xylan/chitin deacetylase (PgdA/CDA1 family)